MLGVPATRTSRLKGDGQSWPGYLGSVNGEKGKLLI